jgi:gliding motility-associated-like protein
MPICDASGFTFTDLNAYALDEGNGIRWYNVSTGGSPLNVNQLVSQGTYYADDNSGTCGSRVSVVVDFQVNPTGQNLDRIYCSSDFATIQTYIDDVLQFGIPPGGSVEVYNDLALTNQASTTDAIPGGAKNYYIVFVDNGGCKSQIERGSTAVFTAPADPTPANPQAFCSNTNPTVADLDPGTTGSYNWYQNIDLSGEPILPALLPGTPLVNGNTYYVQVNDIFCDSNAIPVTANISVPFEPGTSGSLEYCNDNISPAGFDLFDELGGPKDTNGIWTGPLATANGFQGTVDISTLTAAGNYVFTYTVPSNGACPEDTSNVSITIYETLSSGTVSAANPATYCEKDLPTSFDLFSLLDNEDVGGQWTQGATVISNPSSLDLTYLTASAIPYDFTYTQNGLPSPCPEELTTVQVSVLQDPNAGTPSNQIFCENDLGANSPFDLFSAISGQDNNSGTWTDATNAAISNSIDITGFTTVGSPYLFTYTISNGTCEDTETVSVTVEPAPESGSPVLVLTEFCEGLAPASYDLFNLLTGEDQTGIWYSGIDNTGSAIANPTDLSVLTPGTYSFTYDVNAIGTCDDVLVTVSVTINPLPNTGVPSPATFCENDLAANSPLSLLGQLSGQDSGGTWTDDNTSGALTGTEVNLNILTIGTYNYTYSITDANGCSNSSTVSITVEDAPESGTVDAPLQFCTSEITAGQTVNLFDLLIGEDQAGVWSDDNATGALSGNTLTIDGLAVGNYNFTYDVNAIGSCDDVLVTVSVIINPLPNTGTSLPTVFCENDLAANSPLDLFARLSGEDTGGTWSDDSTSGALTGNDVDLTLLAIGNYDFTYSITDANGCTNRSTVTVQVDDAPESGTANVPALFCEGIAPSNYNLFDLLTGADLTGNWYIGLDNLGAATTNIIDLSAYAANIYNFTYDVNAIGSCDDELVTVQITINPLPNTGTPIPTVFCENDLAANSPLDLFARLSGEDTGGSWTDDNTSGALTGSDVDLTLLTLGNYDFTYSITDANGCTNSSTVTVQVNDAPESGTANAPLEFCISDITAAQTVDLFDLLTDEDQTGTWSDDDASGGLSGNTVTIDGLAANTYNFTYDVNNIGSCDDVNVTVSIVITDAPAPTASPLQEFCDTPTVVNLVASGTAIKWYDDATGGTALTDTTALVNGEDYFASQTDATTGCESSIRTLVTATIYQTPDAGNPNSTSIVACNNSTIDLNSGLDGTQDSGGTWYEGSDNTGALIIDPSSYDVTGMSANNYQFTYYVIASAPCLDDSTTISVTIEEPLNAGTNNTLDVCSNNGTTDLFTLLGSADSGGTWSPALASTTGVFDPLVDAGGTYRYTLSNACGTLSSEVVVTVTQAPNAGTDNTVAVCVIDGPTDLFTLLGTAQTGGTWSPLLNSGTGVFDPLGDAPGVYTYTITATAPCNPDSTAEITVSVGDSSPPTVLASNPSYCLVNNPTVADLNTSISASGTVSWYADAALTTQLNATDGLIDGEDYYATNTDTSGCPSSLNVQVDVTVNDSPTPTLEDSGMEYCINDSPTINTLSLNITEYDDTSNNLVWYDTATGGNSISTSTSLSNNTTYYVALVDATTGCESSVRLEVNPDLTACGVLVLPDGFSPNGDGVNDTYDVDNLEFLYPNFEIEIYNRYGNMVYKGNAQTPRFNGKSNQSRTIGSGDLPVGMYYYIFQFNDGINKPKQGNLYLSR